MTTKWMFEDSSAGIHAIFDTEKEAKRFMNAYRIYMYEEYDAEYYEDDLEVYEYFYNPSTPAELLEAEEG